MSKLKVTFTDDPDYDADPVVYGYANLSFGQAWIVSIPVTGWIGPYGSVDRERAEQDAADEAAALWLPGEARSRIMIDTDWPRRAACLGKNPDLFFPDRGGDHGAAAKRVCSGCPVRIECLDAAITEEALPHAVDWRSVHGIRGGTTPQERIPLVLSRVNLIATGRRLLESA